MAKHLVPEWKRKDRAASGVPRSAPILNYQVGPHHRPGKQTGPTIIGRVIEVGPDVVVVSAGLKSGVVIRTAQFKNERGEIEVSVGDEVKVALSTTDYRRRARLWREKAKRAYTWKRLETAFERNEVVTGLINGRVKGGFTVKIGFVRAFLPGSEVDVNSIRGPCHLEGKKREFKIIRFDQQRNNVVVSRRAVVEQGYSAERSELLDKLQEGAVLRGVVKNLTEYGALVDLGGIDGLLHSTEMAWKRVKHPSEVVNVGDEIEVRILKFDRERQRVSLGLKQLGSDPWQNIASRYPAGTRLFGKVTNIADYGCFVEIEEGVEGLVHVSEMDWTNKNVNPSKVVHIGEEVEVMVLDIDEERRRISLGIKQCKPNPWREFADIYNRGDKVNGQIRSITDFGLFIGLPGGIDGLVHLSDLSWDVPGEEAVHGYQKGQTVEAVVVAIDPERERISLSVKQLAKDPFSSWIAEHPKGGVVRGLVREVDAKGAIVDLGGGIDGYLRASELSRDRVEDARAFLKVGDEVEAKFTAVDRKVRTVVLSIKAKDMAEEQEAMHSHRSDSTTGTSLGDPSGPSRSTSEPLHLGTTQQVQLGKSEHLSVVVIRRLTESEIAGALSQVPDWARDRRVSEVHRVRLAILGEVKIEEIIEQIMETAPTPFQVPTLHSVIRDVDPEELAVIGVFRSGACRTVGSVTKIDGSRLHAAPFDYWALIDPDDPRESDSLSGLESEVDVFAVGTA